MLLLGVIALAVVGVGLVVALRLARAQEADELPPPSEPTDFVAPVSSGGYAWRGTDETPEQFRERVARQNAEAQVKART